MLTNGAGEPRIPIDQVKPGTIARFGVDDDMTVMVLANFESTYYVGDGKGGVVTKPCRKLVMFGCFCDEPDEFDPPGRPYEEGRLMEQTFASERNETMTVLLIPE